MSLLDKQLKEGLLLSLLPQFKNKEKKALNDISEMQRISKKNYVSCSWGKQSIIVAHMVYRIDKDINIVFFNGPDSELIADFNNVRNQFLEKYKINYFEYPEAERHLKTSAWKLVEEYNYTGFYMGLSACESKGRTWTLKKGKRNIYLYKNNIYRCCPLAYWTVNDCAAYIAKYKLPLLSTYKKYGIEARTSAGVTPGTHAEQGIDILSSENQYEINKRWKERHKNGIK